MIQGRIHSILFIQAINLLHPSTDNERSQATMASRCPNNFHFQTQHHPDHYTALFQGDKAIYRVPYRDAQRLAVFPLPYSHTLNANLFTLPLLGTSYNTGPTHKTFDAVASATCSTDIIACGPQRHRKIFLWHYYDQASVKTIN